jgi:hypothetical protein
MTKQEKKHLDETLMYRYENRNISITRKKLVELMFKEGRVAVIGEASRFATKYRLNRIGASMSVTKIMFDYFIKLKEGNER